MFAAPKLECPMNRRLPRFQCEETNHGVSGPFVVGDQAVEQFIDVASRSGSLRIDLRGQNLDRDIQQALLAAESTDDGLYADTGFFGDEVEGDFVVPLLHELAQKRVDDAPPGRFRRPGP